MSVRSEAFFRRISNDHRSAASNAALSAVMAGAGANEASVSIGGGPSRVHPRLKNLNIEWMENVDVVGTAYRLPFDDRSVGVVHCEAVLEHLEYPQDAVDEMFRVLRPGGQVFAATPFLQGFHGFPSHFQNYTLVGHRRLFERSGFEIVSSGIAVGPAVALTDLLTLCLRELLPGRVFPRAVARVAWLILLPARSLDRILNLRRASHAVASTTYVRAMKPR